ncbi:AMP-dependent synthetase [Thioclava sp. L04-15]|uniref:AMP-binding protein n=1 Tax=Thioclava sp. L04-15 TaxID=1915318 RepID=UPI0009973963|nr:AMP-binding protein [Thioclava sp. L04-15]OOY27965.1 AMP-dependent synthetase [Thioclava sp. L04-15]TNE83312.1 MAG: AMP-dependent synthetase [Paracoccaceae bacterium]
MLSRGKDYAATRAAFRWEIPERYNIGVDVCDKWAAADPDRIALIEVEEDGYGAVRETTFAELRAASNRFANVLASIGVGGNGKDAGDRVAILLPQRRETAIAHIAAFKAGCVSLPLFTLFGPEALLHRLRDSGARVLVTDPASYEMIAGLRADLPGLQTIFVTDGGADGAEEFDAALAGASPEFTPVDTSAETPGVLIYTSGTTGNPKGALHAHRVLLGHLPGVEMSHDFLPQEGDRIWTPADWAWIGGLLDVLLPSLHHGVPVVACRFRKFSAQAAADLIRRLKVRNAFLPPTALKMMKADPESLHWDLQMRSVASGGEPLGTQLLDWGRKALGVTINEFYGQTECNMVVSSASSLDAPEPGAMGWPVPGHEVAIVDSLTGERLPKGSEGAIAVRAPDPVMFLGYWNLPEATETKFVTGPEGRWLLTGDRGVSGSGGRLRFKGRDDDIISTGGYRVGPAEIEDCLISHPAVQMAGVVGQPDPLRGEIVAAFVTLCPGHSESEALREDLAQHVRARLAKYEYPRAIYVIDDMPVTTTGKIIRNALRARLPEETTQ